MTSSVKTLRKTRNIKAVCNNIMKDVHVFSLIFINCYLQIYAQLGSNCTTPNKESAFCFPLTKCDQLNQSLANLSPSKEKFYNASICGSLNSSEPLVCCGLLDDYQTVDYASLLLDTLPPSIKIDELLPTKKCGLQVAEEKVFGGYETSIDEFPWMAMLEYRNKFGKHTGFGCGGVIISSRYILTAAHCVVGAIEEDFGKLYKVRLGEHDIRTPIDCQDYEGELDCIEPPQYYYVEQVVVHEDYIRNESSIINDIVLIRLAKPINFTDFIRPICLPLEKEKSASGEKLIVAGWGRIEDGTYSPVKMKVDLDILNKTVCDNIYGSYNITLTTSQICAMGDTGKDTCSGDSGGPLMRTFPKNNLIWYVEGIVSFGPTKCAMEGIPGVYSSVPDFVDWIIENIKE